MSDTIYPVINREQYALLSDLLSGPEGQTLRGPQRNGIPQAMLTPYTRSDWQRAAVQPYPVPDYMKPESGSQGGDQLEVYPYTTPDGFTVVDPDRGRRNRAMYDWQRRMEAARPGPPIDEEGRLRFARESMGYPTPDVEQPSLLANILQFLSGIIPVAER